MCVWCVHECICVCVSTGVGIWHCMCGRQRKPGMFVHSFWLGWNRVSLAVFAAVYVRLADPRAPGSSVSASHLTFVSTEITDTCTHAKKLGFTWFWGSQLRFSHTYIKLLTHWTVFPTFVVCFIVVVVYMFVFETSSHCVIWIIRGFVSIRLQPSESWDYRRALLQLE